MCQQGNCRHEGVSVRETLTGVRADLWGREYSGIILHGTLIINKDGTIDLSKMSFRSGCRVLIGTGNLADQKPNIRRSVETAMEAVRAAADQKGIKVPTQ